MKTPPSSIFQSLIFQSSIFALAVSSQAASFQWTQADGYRAAPLQVSGTSPGFTRMTSAGIDFTNEFSSERYTTNQIYLNGSGVAAGDVDGDGLVDLYFAALTPDNVLFRNMGGWKFTNATPGSGVACEFLDCSGAALADLNGDDRLDLVVNSVGGGTHCFANDGAGRFRSMSLLNPRKGGMSLALGDIDGDRDLDLYIANYRTSTFRDQPNTRLRVNNVNGKYVVLTVNGRPVTDPEYIGRFTLDANGQILEHGEPDALYRNDGNGRFTRISFTEGSFLDADGQPLAAPPYEWGLSVMFRDINGDLAPDIYVCNDFRGEDRIWINDGQGRFRALPALAIRTSSMFSMGVDFADLNHDGLEEFFVADMLSRDHSRRHLQVAGFVPTPLALGDLLQRPEYSRNTLFLHRPDHTFAEIGQWSGVDASEWSWTPIFLDVDLDGHQDLLVTTGHERDAMHADVAEELETIKKSAALPVLDQLKLRNKFPRLAVPNIIFRNLGDLRFEDATAAWGFGEPSVSQGMALADLDNDGDMDVAINNLNGPAWIYRNNAPGARIAVRLQGHPPNTKGIGAKIKLTGGPHPQTQEITAGGRYLSSDDPMRSFAAPNPAATYHLEVFWRSGRRSVIRGVKPNYIYEISETSSEPWTNPAPQQPAPWFKDISDRLGHVHHEESFDDFARQPMLSRKLSQLGPGLCWFDFNEDGWDDLIIGAGRGGRLAVFHNIRDGKFRLATNGFWSSIATRDLTTPLALHYRSSEREFAPSFLVGLSNYEDGLAFGFAARQFKFDSRIEGRERSGAATDLIPAHASSAGSLCLADVDGDGDLDLFVGGRSVPGRYPAPATSLLYTNHQGKFLLARQFEKCGLVSAALFTDLTGDGFPELALACEWGPVKVFLNRQGQLADITEPMGLAGHKGWWNGLAAGDFNGDGKLDLVASNWGLNSKYRASPAQPLRIHFGDFDTNGVFDLIETYTDTAGTERPERGFKSIGQALPILKEKIGSYETYSKLTFQELFGAITPHRQTWEATTLASTLFLNRGTHFEAVPLPWEAQLAPAFGISVADFDADGFEDLFLAQNFFAVHPDTARCDSGRGLVLKGDGHGGFTALDGEISGVKLYGDQRGSALSDLDRDGRVDLAVTQNAHATRLYLNQSPSRGRRIRLKGPPRNFGGVGAVLRLKRGEQFGPAREIHAGSGYWSMDGLTQVIHCPSGPAELHILWPGGKKTTVPLPDTPALAVDFQGAVSTE